MILVSFKLILSFSFPVHTLRVCEFLFSYACTSLELDLGVFGICMHACVCLHA